MKVLLLNGSPHQHGCTATALEEVGGALAQCGVETQKLWIGNRPVRGCIACGGCRKTGVCVFDDDPANEIIRAIQGADGLVVGAPVHYASAGGAAVSLLDRVFYAAGRSFAGKPAAAVASARRAGTTATLDELNKYFMISAMPVVSSTYWNMVHGNTPDEVRQDLEGLQIMRNLGRNMAWLLRCIEAGRAAGDSFPQQDRSQYTNFIR